MKHWRYLLFLAVFGLALWPACRMLAPDLGMLAAFDGAALVFVLSCVGLWGKGTSALMRAHAERDDAGQILLLGLTGLIGAAVLLALVPLVTQKDALPLPLVALLVATLALSWLFTNLIFTFHYARLYYAQSGGRDFGGLDFQSPGDPEFADFVNFAFVIGMTCQTADITITHPKMRRIATGHGLYAFVFNLGVLAMTVNVLASR